MGLKQPWTFENPLCAEVGSFYFYMEDDGFPVSFNDYRKARSLCDRCPEKFDCAEWGIAKEQFGIWGGLTPKERRLIRRRRRIKDNQMYP